MNQEGVEGEEGEGGWQAAGPTPPPAALHTKPRMMQSWSGAAGGLEETWAPRVGRVVGSVADTGDLWMPDPDFPAPVWLLYVAPGLLLKDRGQTPSPKRKVAAGVRHDATRTSLQAAAPGGRATPHGGGRQ